MPAAAPRRIPISAPLAAALLLACSALAPPLAAQDAGTERRTLAGTVVDAETGGPVSGALVALPGRNRGVFTDAQGRFSLRDFPAGPHALVVAQLGYDSLTARVEVTESVGSMILRLRPNPVVLEGIRVVSDRIRSRRNAVAASVRAFDQDDLRGGASRTALEFIQTRTALQRTACLDRLSIASCAYVRGRPTPVAVYVDDMQVFGGLEMLDSYRPEELFLVEVYSGGRQIRVYTNWYIAWSARTGRRPMPILIW